MDEGRPGARILWVAGLLSTFVAVGGGAGEPRAAAEVVAALQARYDSTASFRAAFSQEIHSQAFGSKLVSHGTVYFRRPARMRWEFTEPDRQTVVADGKSLWMYQESQKQVVKVRLENAFQTTTPLSFLIGLGNLSEDFEAQLKKDDEGLVLRLRSRAQGSEVGVLDLELEPKTYDIVGAVVTDASGGTTQWKFRDLERNVSLADDLFEFSIPKGVDVVVPPS